MLFFVICESVLGAWELCVCIVRHDNALETLVLQMKNSEQV